ncbi:MAG: hypothetical protein U0Q12_06565 [Vicinamibacterales bacterium]
MEDQVARTLPRGPLWPGFVAVFATMLLYAPARLMDFAGDDALVLERVTTFHGLSSPGAYFGFGFFSFYRPIAFLSHALDWQLWGPDPSGFHTTNVVLHAINVWMVYVLARRMLGAWWAVAAATFFATHASNHEAVFWVAGRFDLMATFWTLAAFWLMTTSTSPRKPGSTGAIAYALGLAAFALGLLSKESALAFPLIVTAHDVFVAEMPVASVVRRMAGIVLVLAAYVFLRASLAALDPTGGASRLPKALGLVGGLAALAGVAHATWPRVADRLGRVVAPRLAGRVLVGGLVLLGAASAVPSPLAGFLREKLAFAGFSLFYLVSPVVSPLREPWFLDATTPAYWLAGLAAVTVVGAGLFARRGSLVDGVWMWLLVFVAAALLPVSSMTEGQRYLYLASVGAALAAARALRGLAHARSPLARPALGVAAVVVVLSCLQIQAKGRDWAWAGRMTREGVTTVARRLEWHCADRDVVFLTAPVGIRGVYSHFYRDTFALGGCVPASFVTVARMVLSDGQATARWLDARRVEIRLTPNLGNIVLSRDLRQFDVPLRREPTASLETPLGRVDARPEAADLVVTLSFADRVDLARTAVFYYADGEVHSLPVPSEGASDSTDGRGSPAPQVQ